MPQPSRHTLSRGALGSTLAREISATTVYSENVLQPMKWNRLLPLQEKRVVPSGIKPLPWVSLENETQTQFWQQISCTKRDFHGRSWSAQLHSALIHWPDLLTQVGFGILTELAFSTLWDVQGYGRVPWNTKSILCLSFYITCSNPSCQEARKEREPGWNLVTPSPTLSTMPAPSWPSTTGKTPSGSEPLSV